MGDNEEERPPYYEMPPIAATPNLVTVEMAKAMPRYPAAGKRRGVKDKPIVGVIMLIALLLLALALLSSIR